MKPTKETLERLYLVEQKSLQEIALLYGKHRNQIRRWLIREAIPLRSLTEAMRIKDRTGPKSPAHQEALRKSIAEARKKITKASHRKQSASMMGKPAWNKGKKWTPEHRAKHMAYRTTEEYRRKQSERQKGEKSHLWRGGITPADDLRMQGYKWKLRRKEVYERDQWLCQDCGAKCLSIKDSRPHPKRRIACHHIIRRRDGGSDDLENLVTLCASCHLKRERRYTNSLFA